MMFTHPMAVRACHMLVAHCDGPQPVVRGGSIDRTRTALFKRLLLAYGPGRRCTKLTQRGRKIARYANPEGEKPWI